MIEYNLPLKRTKYPNEMSLGSYKSGRFFIILGRNLMAGDISVYSNQRMITVRRVDKIPFALKTVILPKSLYIG